MLETLLKYASVYLGSMFKFVLGPIAGMASNLSFIESAIFTILGMMTTVFIILILGKVTRDWLIARLGLDKRMARQSEGFKKIWAKYGIPAIAFFTPLFLTPIGGAILAVTMEASRRKIMRYMFVSAVFWGFAISFLFDRLGTVVFGF